MSEQQVWLMVAVIALVTAGLRFLPFVLFGGGRKTPAVIDRLGSVLPSAVMAMLVVYCLRGVRFDTPAGWLPSVIACLLTAGLHVWRRSTLLSIVGGTVCYMLLVQLVF
ncbi:MAG: branched-chain amino acid transporter AzlD [Clostridiales bacterium]|nr:branched-chain amino acid transporter AzlD [Clostridiales bacterium]